MARVSPGVIPGSPGKGAARAGLSRCLALVLVVAAGCAQASDGPETGTPCSDAWYRLIEQNVPTGDGRGHGPDIGSDEWKSVVEFRLGIRGKPELARRDGEAMITRGYGAPVMRCLKRPGGADEQRSGSPAHP